MTTLENATHGGNSQAIMLTRQLHRSAMKEGRMPNCLYVGADNTLKETKNSTVITWAIFILISLRSTTLSAIEFQYPLVGHTHGSLDRFFSRLIVSLRGRSYLTFHDMEAVSREGLKGFSMNWTHHGSSFDWNWVRKIFGMEFHRYRNVHALRLQMDSTGLWIKWKQYVSDMSWSSPILLAPVDKFPVLEQASPPFIPHAFDEKDQAKYFNFLDKLETWLQTHINIPTQTHS